MHVLLRRLIPALAAVALSARAQTPDLATAPETGRWLTQTGSLEVEIAPCGAALCGTVVKVLSNRAMSSAGGALLAEAPAAAAPAPSPLGLTILRDFKPIGAGEWQGRIVNRDTGELYDCIMSMAIGGELTLHGYKGLRALGKTFNWTRVAPRSVP